ncbi:MAG: hypothetical protein PHS37_06180, partial [Candidatus Omnitrophica bacterium]|nr:hypothetical protein [Candidatus Omnitrophota bacterium]
VHSNLRLVVSIAKEFRWAGMDMMDLIQQGNMALSDIVGEKRWQGQRGLAFSTYAYPYIHGILQTYVYAQKDTIRVPAYVRIEINNFKRLCRKHAIDPFKKTLDNFTIAEKLGIDIERIAWLREAMFGVLSLNAAYPGSDKGESGSTLEAGLAAADEEPGRRMERLDAIKRVIELTVEKLRITWKDPAQSRIDVLKSYILPKMFGIGVEHSMDEVGRMFDPPVSRSRIQQISSEVMREMEGVFKGLDLDMETYVQDAGSLDPTISAYGEKELISREKHEERQGKLGEQMARIALAMAKKWNKIMGAADIPTYMHRGKRYYDLRKAVKLICEKENCKELSLKINGLKEVTFGIETVEVTLNGLANGQRHPKQTEPYDILVITGDKIDFNHAGRNALTVYAHSRAKAIHEKSELASWISFARHEIKVTEEEIASNRLGDRILEWASRMNAAGYAKAVREAKHRFHEIACKEELRYQLEQTGLSPDTVNLVMTKVSLAAIEYLINHDMMLHVREEVETDDMVLSSNGRELSLSIGCINDHTMEYLEHRIVDYVEYLRTARKEPRIRSHCGRDSAKAELMAKLVAERLWLKSLALDVGYFGAHQGDITAVVKGHHIEYHNAFLEVFSQEEFERLDGYWRGAGKEKFMHSIGQAEIAVMRKVEKARSDTMAVAAWPDDIDPVIQSDPGKTEEYTSVVRAKILHGVLREREIARFAGNIDEPQPMLAGIPAVKSGLSSSQGTPGTRADIINTFLGDITNEENLAKIFKIALESYELDGKKVVIAVQNGLGMNGSDLSLFMEHIEKWKRKMIRDFPQRANLLNNLIVLKPFADAGDLEAQLDEQKMNGDERNNKDKNYIFVVARHNAEAARSIAALGAAIRPSYIDEKGEGFTNYYYPLIEIVALSMIKEFLEGDIHAIVEKMRKEADDFPIESVSEEAGSLIFAIIPKITPYGPDEHMKKFARVLRFLRSA